MRLSRTALLLLGAFAVPVIVELRTLLGFFGVEVGLRTVLAVAAVVFGTLAVLALFADDEGASGEPSRTRT